VEGFFKGAKPWLAYHDELISPLSEIVGALPHEVVVMNQLTVNLHLMMTTFYQPEGSERKLSAKAKPFPAISICWKPI
jgi:kynureninase